MHSDLAQPMSYFLQYEENPNDLTMPHTLLHRMAQFVVRSGVETQQVWVDLLKDMLSIRDQVCVLHFMALGSSLSILLVGGGRSSLTWMNPTATACSVPRFSIPAVRLSNQRNNDGIR